MDDRLAIELSRAQRYEKSLTLAVIDADRFKSLNDNYGHATGDAVLKKIAGLLRSFVRQSDTVGRYGGEEFVVLLPETELEAGRGKLESLQERVAGTVMETAGGEESLQVTISAGLASYPQDGRDAAELFATADEPMFRAKREGGNRVVAGANTETRAEAVTAAEA